LSTLHRPTPTWNHPLFGADPLTLGRALLGNGPLPARVWPLVLAMAAASLARAPLSLIERAHVALRAPHLPDSAPPVFILGHWRSGTTHLFNLLSRDPQFAWPSPFATGLPWDFLLLGRLLRPLLKRALPEDRYIDRVAVTEDAPQEDEIGLAAMQNLSYYHGLYFPSQFERHYRRGVFFDALEPATLARWQRRLRHYCAKLRLERPGTRLLVKNPVYTGRVALLREMFPDARFVHIRRNPYVVFQSTRRFYRALLPQMALQPWRETEADALILETYPRMIEALERDVADLPEDRYMELSFEDLEADPMPQLERIYRRLALPGFESAAPAFARHLDGVRGYTKNAHRFPEDAVALVDAHWGRFVQAWGYEAPR